jgi:hypothetical protein
MQRPDPDEVARLLADEARPVLGAEGFSDERIDELASAFVTHHVGEGRTPLARGVATGIFMPSA